MRSIRRLSQVVLYFIDGIPKCWSETVVDNVTDFVIGIKVLGFEGDEAWTIIVELSVGTLFRNLMTGSILDRKRPMCGIRSVDEAGIDWIVCLEAHDIVKVFVHEWSGWNNNESCQRILNTSWYNLDNSNSVRSRLRSLRRSLDVELLLALGKRLHLNSWACFRRRACAWQNRR